MIQIAVISGKGGTGKTTLTGALASYFSGRIAVDGDVDASNLYMLFEPKVFEKYDYVASKKAVINTDGCIRCGICKDVCIFDAVKIDEGGNYVIDVFACEGCGYCYYACPVRVIDMYDEKSGEYYFGISERGPLTYSSLFPGEEASGGLVAEVRRLALQKSLDDPERPSIIIDGAPGVACPAISSVTGTNYVIIVTEPTVSGLHDLGRAAEMVSHFNIPFGVVVNKYDLSVEKTEDIKQWCEDKGVEFLGEIPFDLNVVKATRAAQSVIDMFPDTPASLAIMEIIKKLEEKFQI